MQGSEAFPLPLHDLNLSLDFDLDLARAAKEGGVKVHLFISAAGVSASSSLPYPMMEGELEEEVQKLDFEHTVNHRQARSSAWG